VSLLQRSAEIMYENLVVLREKTRYEKWKR